MLEIHIVLTLAKLECLGLLQELKHQKLHYKYIRAFLMATVSSHFPQHHPHYTPYHFSFELIACSQSLAYFCLSLQAIMLCQFNLTTRGLCICPPSALMPAIDPSLLPEK